MTRYGRRTGSCGSVCTALRATSGCWSGRTARYSGESSSSRRNCQLVAHDRRRDDSAKREREWLAEHDSNVRALLHIIRHHEAANEELQREVEQLQAKEAVGAAVVKVSRSAQTDMSHGRWALRDSAAEREVDTQTTACIKVNASFGLLTSAQSPACSLFALWSLQDLYDQLQQSKKKKVPGWCDAPISQEVTTRPVVLMSASRPDFRSAVMKRLRQSQEHHRTEIRPLPIPEVIDEDDDVGKKQGGGELQDDHKNTKDKTVAASGPSSGLMRHYQGLEEQNRRLQERLESQQSLLDQLLSIKLDQVSSPAKLVDGACDASASSAKKAETTEDSGTSSFADCPVSVQTSGKCDRHDKQASTLSRASTLRLDTSAGIAAPLPPSQRPHPMSPPAA